MPDKIANSGGISVDSLEARPIEIDQPEGISDQDSVVSKLRLLWGQRRFLWRMAGIGLAASVCLAFVIPKRYESTVRLMPPDQSGSGPAMLAAAAMGRGGSAGGSTLGSGLGSLGGIAGDLLGMKTSGALFIGLLQSRTIEDDLIHKFNLQKVYSDRHISDARLDLEKKTDASEDRKSGIITIKVIDRSPERATAMAQAYVDQLNDMVARVNTTSAHRERVFLEDRLTQVKQDLETAEKNFSDFASKNTALDIPSQAKATIEAAALLNGQLIAAQTELEGLKQLYTNNNVRVRSMQARVDELQHQLENIGGKFDTRGDSSATQSNEPLYPSIRQLPVLGVNYADLFRNTRVQESIFETLTQEYELAKVQEVKETPSVKVVDAPDVPDKKSFPPRLIIIVLGTLFAFCAGMMWIFSRQMWEAMDPQDPQKLLALEVFNTAHARLPRFSRNGAGSHANDDRAPSLPNDRQIL